MYTKLSYKYVVKYLVYFILCMLAMMFTNGIGFVVVVLGMLAALVMGKANDLFFWLLAAVSMMIGNGNLMPKGVEFAIMHRSLLACVGCVMLIAIFTRKLSPYISPFYLIFLYIFPAVISSWQGWHPLISTMKIVLFSLIFVSYCGVANKVMGNVSVKDAHIREIVVAMAVFFIIGSLILVRYPAISQLKADEFLKNPDLVSLFMGMTSHSQCLGPVITSLSVILFADYVFSIRKFNCLYLFLLLSSPYVIYLTSSRTAMGSYILGMGCVLYFFLREKSVMRSWKSKVITGSLFVFAAIVIAVCSVGSVQEGITKFLLKWESGKDTAELSYNQITGSRQGKWEHGMYNFHKSPIFGNGFQVSEDMEGYKIDSVKQLITAPVEKSVWVSAILEEGGAIGFGCFVIFIVIFLLKLLKLRAYICVSVFLTVMTLNLGEFTIFSMSYAGGVEWAMIIAGVVLDRLRARQSQLLNKNYREETYYYRYD